MAQLRPKSGGDQSDSEEDSDEDEGRKGYRKPVVKAR